MIDTILYLIHHYHHFDIAGFCMSGLHIHLSVWGAESDKNMFPDATGDYGLSDVGRQFMAGVLKHAREMSAMLSPTVNSYKRSVRKQGHFPQFVGLLASISKDFFFHTFALGPGCITGIIPCITCLSEETTDGL